MYTVCIVWLLTSAGNVYKTSLFMRKYRSILTAAQLYAELSQLNLNLPARVCIPLYEGRHQILRVPSSEAVVLNSKSKVHAYYSTVPAVSVCVLYCALCIVLCVLLLLLHVDSACTNTVHMPAYFELLKTQHWTFQTIVKLMAPYLTVSTAMGQSLLHCL